MVPIVLICLIPLLAYGYIFILAVEVAVGVLAFLGLHWLLVFAPSSTTTRQEGIKWRGAIMGSMAGTAAYGCALYMIMAWAPLPADTGTPTLQPARFFHEAADCIIILGTNLLISKALLVGFWHGFIAGWRSGFVFKAPPLPPPLPSATPKWMTPRLRRLVFTVLWAPLTTAAYLLCLLSASSIVGPFVPVAPNFHFRGATAVKESAPLIGLATIFLCIFATLVWRIWKQDRLPFGILQSSDVSSHIQRIKEALARFGRVVKLSPSDGGAKE